MVAAVASRRLEDNQLGAVVYFDSGRESFASIFYIRFGHESFACHFVDCFFIWLYQYLRAFAGIADLVPNA